MRRNESADKEKIEVVKRYVGTLSFTSVKLYAVNAAARYITSTETSNLKSRVKEDSRIATLTVFDPNVALIASGLKQIAPWRTIPYSRVDVCIDLYSLWKKVGTIYFETGGKVMVVGKDYFLLKENDVLISLIKRSVKEKIR